MRDFSKKTLAALARKGIVITGFAAIPNMALATPFASADRGYAVDDNGCGRIWTFSQVLEAAQ